LHLILGSRHIGVKERSAGIAYSPFSMPVSFDVRA
jgi:hypothetical protein